MPHYFAAFVAIMEEAHKRLCDFGELEAVASDFLMSCNDMQ